MGPRLEHRGAFTTEQMGAINEFIGKHGIVQPGQPSVSDQRSGITIDRFPAFLSVTAPAGKAADVERELAGKIAGAPDYAIMRGKADPATGAVTFDVWYTGLNAQQRQAISKAESGLPKKGTYRNAESGVSVTIGDGTIRISAPEPDPKQAGAKANPAPGLWMALDRISSRYLEYSSVRTSDGSQMTITMTRIGNQAVSAGLNEEQAVGLYQYLSSSGRLGISGENRTGNPDSGVEFVRSGYVAHLEYDKSRKPRMDQMIARVLPPGFSRTEENNGGRIRLTITRTGFDGRQSKSMGAFLRAPESVSGSFQNAASGVSIGISGGVATITCPQRNATQIEEFLRGSANDFEGRFTLERSESAGNVTLRIRQNS
jgi:hypothetical protein